MKRALAALVAIAALAVPATASAVDRQVATTCYGSVMIAQRFNPVVTVNTGIPCPNFVPSLDKPWYVIHRPLIDWYAADEGARRFWPGCGHVRYAVTDKRSSTGWYHTFYHVCEGPV